MNSQSESEDSTNEASDSPVSSESQAPNQVADPVPVTENVEQTVAANEATAEKGTPISTPQQLQEISNDLSGSYYLTQDIDMTGFAFTPLGNSTSTTFTGIFDGNGYEVQNLNISSTSNYQGLFGCVGTGGQVTNLGVTGSVSGKQYIGGIAGYVNGGMITNSYSEVNVTGSGSNVGGVAGYVNSSTVTNCYNTGAVTGSGSSVGGVAGYVYKATITNCYNTGAVTKSSNYVGGVAGYISSGTVTNCYNTGVVTGSGSSVGGVAGNVYSGTVSNCYYNTNNAGYAVTAIGSGSGTNVSGLTLEEITGSQALTHMVFTSDEGVWVALENSTDVNEDGTITYYSPQLSVFVKNPSAPQPEEMPTLMEYFFSDGTIGMAPTYISTPEQLQAVNENLVGNYVLTNDIDLSTIENFTPLGSSSSNAFCGIFDGNGHEVQNLEVGNTTADYQGLFGCVGANGKVMTVGVTGSVSGKQYVGGIAGYVDDGTITNSYSEVHVIGSGSSAGGVAGYIIGTVINCYNTGDVTGEDEVGGVAGSLTGTVTNCYNTGLVSGSGSSVGGVAGNVYSGTVSNCYYNAADALTAIGSGSGSGTNVSALTLEEITGSQALTHMVFTSDEGVWVALENSTDANEDGTITYYSPQLSVFVKNPSAPQPEEMPTLMEYFFSDGTIGMAPTYISTPEQLQAVNENLVGNYVLTNDIDLSTIENFTPLGSSSSNAFCGIFDGNGHEVQNLEVGNITADYQGLFGCVGATGKVMRVGVTGFVRGKQYVGGIAGYVLDGVGYVDGVEYPEGGTITNSYSEVHVIGSSSSVGGVAGYIAGSVINCYHTGVVTGEDEVGGVAGKVDEIGVIGTSCDATVINCYNTGVVTGEDYVGGVVGYTYHTNVSNCYNVGKVVGDDDVGGVAGDICGCDVINCCNTGEVTGDESVGGVIGYTEHASDTTDCCNTGEVTGDDYVGGVVGHGYANADITNCYNTGEVTGESYIGGVAGDEGKDADITNCYNTGEVTGEYRVGGVIGLVGDTSITNCYNKGEVTGLGCIGGVAGYMSPGVEVINCYNTGKITETRPGRFMGPSQVLGGVVGEIYSGGIVINCYNTGELTVEVTGEDKTRDEHVGGVVGEIWSGGTVTNCYNTGAVTGSGSDVGGVAGYVYKGTITNCYNTGEVTGDYHVGGVAGCATDSTVIANCYYNTDNAGGATKAIDSGSGTCVYGLNTEEMTGSEALTNMVFTSDEGTWVTLENALDGTEMYYPQLSVFVEDPSNPQPQEMPCA